MSGVSGHAVMDGSLHGVVELEGANAVYIDPVKLSGTSYCNYRIIQSEYYSRSLDFAKQHEPERENECFIAEEGIATCSKKRRRGKRINPCLDQKNIQATARHQEVRQAIIKAYTAYQNTEHLRLVTDIQRVDVGASNSGEELLDFVKLANIWQAPMYTITVHALGLYSDELDGAESKYQLFNTMVSNDKPEEVIAECSGCLFVMPRNSRFFISDIREVQQLVSDDAWGGYNLLLLDPPWENRSVKRKSLYPTLPNRYLLSLPIKRLVHASGALVALWVTNREKLRRFIETELLPAWGVVSAASWYWLKVTPDGKMLSPLDLAHHKPYECLLLGYVSAVLEAPNDAAVEDVLDNSVVRSRRDLPDKHVIISVPGDHSRKPAVGSLLAKYAPGPRPVRGLELFARELNAGWTSWGNEPLHFQSLKYFRKIAEKPNTVGK